MKTERIILLINLLLIVSLGAAEEEPGYGTGQGIAYYEQIPEEHLIASSDARAFRPDSSTLCLITTEGDTVTFSDTPEIEDISFFSMYKLVARLQEQDYWIVQLSMHEWAEYLLVSGKNGNYSRAISVPVASPDGRRLLCAYRDIIACFVDNGIQIWRIDPDSLALEYSALDEGWGPSDAVWGDDSSIVFDMLTVDWETWETHVSIGQIVMTDRGCWEELEPLPERLYVFP